jgi:hypothetical protein
LAITNSATTQIAAGMGTVVLPSLNINGGSSTPTATFDIGANSVVIPYSGASPFNTIKAQVLYASDNLSMDRPGITSSAADGFTTAVGYAEANELFLNGGGDYVNNQSPNQSGSPTVTHITDQAVILKYTYLGDVDLNGTVDAADFNILSSDLGLTGVDWSFGDLDGNGTVDPADFNLLTSNLGQSGLAAGSPSGPVPVPEPSTLLLAALGVVGIAAKSFVRKRRGVS